MAPNGSSKSEILGSYNITKTSTRLQVSNCSSVQLSFLLNSQYLTSPDNSSEVNLLATT